MDMHVGSLTIAGWAQSPIQEHQLLASGPLQCCSPAMTNQPHSGHLAGDKTRDIDMMTFQKPSKAHDVIPLAKLERHQIDKTSN